MSLSKLNIPETISVGFQNRRGTYTGKLAYIVYKDKKGVLRKEKSWNGWRDKSIPVQEFENVPTEGFVLNRKVGDHSYGWNNRKAWIRIYDPRDFEFEIKVENLIFILEECSAIKGKGLEGEFVYSWDRADLVLLPVSSQEYKNSIEFTELQTRKVTKKDMREGCIYRTKDDQEVMYLGRHRWYYTTQKWTSNNPHYRWSYSGRYVTEYHDDKKHIFVGVGADKSRDIQTWIRGSGYVDYWIQPGFTKLAERLTEEPSPQFAEEFEKFKACKQ